ncbi:MAG TPA: addiction module antidote protein, HigA family [Rhodobacteraceae bacterium]|nr:addiction module antidote protein, HigA family [Paracoccaceae bacterium]
MVILANPVHPGEVLKAEFLDEMGLTAGKVARAVMVPRTRIERIVKMEIGVSADTATRLSKFFGTTPEFWLNLQRGFDLSVAAKDEGLSRDLAVIEQVAV